MAYVGLGLDGSWSWLKDIAAEPDAELVGLADPRPELIEKARSMVPPATRFYGDYLRMFEELKPEAVLATMPNAEHLPLLRACAARKIHLWLQMPMARNASEAREMDRLAREAGITLMINFHTWWSKPLRAIMSSVQAGDIGPVQRLMARHAFNAAKQLSPSYSASFLDPKVHGGGALINQGAYGVDYAVSLLGRPTRVFATAKKLREIPGSSEEDEAWIVMDYPKATAIIYGGWWIMPAIGPGVGELTLHGPKGVLARDLDKVTLTRGAAPGSTEAPEPDPQPVAVPLVPRERQNGIAHFIYCIRNRKPVEAPHSPAVNIMLHDVIDAAYESVRTGRPVTLN